MEVTPPTPTPTSSETPLSTAQIQDLDPLVKKEDIALGPNIPISIYRPDIDGLRTIAILPVILFHSYPKIFPSGFIGVDIFFVISGYLISGILFKEMARGSFTYTEFYSRRIRRIYPSLLVVLVSTWWTGCLYLLADSLKSLASTMFAGTLFSANLQILSLDEGYFDASVKEDPLLHLWSLGVEEQFYIFWPMFLITISKLPFQKALAAQFVVAVASFGLNMAFLGFHGANKYSFYVPLCRFWQMSVGGVLAYCHFTMNSATMPVGLQAKITAMQSLFTGFGLICVTFGFLLISEERAFPGAWALLPTIGAVALIAGDPLSQFHVKVLSNNTMVFIGKISYALYLWHWPLLVIAQLRYPNPASRPFYMSPWMMLLVSFVLAVASYKLLEIPMRKVYSKKKYTVAILILLMFIMTAISAITYLKSSTMSFTQQEMNQLVVQEDSSESFTQVESESTPINTNQVDLTSSQNVTSNNTTLSSANIAVSAVSTPGPAFGQSAIAKKKILNSSRGPLLEPPTYLKLVSAGSDWHPNVGYEDLPSNTSIPHIFPLSTKTLNPGKENEHLVMLVGDSHADQVKPRFYQLFKERGATNFPTILTLTQNAMPAIPCSYQAGAIFAPTMSLAKKLKPKALFLVSRYAYYFRPKGNPNDPKHDKQICCYKKDGPCEQNLADVKEILSEMQHSISEIAAQGTKVYVANLTPEGDEFYYYFMVRGGAVGITAPISRKAFRAKFNGLAELIDDTIIAANATIIDFSDNQCDGDVCEVLDRYGNPIMKDSHHFRAKYARQYLGVVDQIVDAAMN